MSEMRKPAAFKIPGASSAEVTKATAKTDEQPRKPRAAAVVELVVEPDVFETEMQALTPAPAIVQTRRSRAGAVFLSAFGLLLSLALGLWVDTLIRDLFSRADWLGYTAIGLVVVAGIALVVVISRELIGLSRLNAASALREEATAALVRNDMGKARNVIEKLDRQFQNVPQTARGRQNLSETKGEVVDGRDLIRLAEHGVLKPLDLMARTMILDSAKRVSIVTAVSPRALVDVAYILFESARLIRRLAELYGGRPGTLGLLRLSKNVIAHLAVTGSIAVGDSLIQQLVGHGVAAKISARLGEGVINGLMTARVGISAMDLVRPLPFEAEKRPGVGDFINELVSISGKKAEAAS